MMRARRGSILVEGALVIPLMLLLLFGVMEVGRAFMGFNLLTHAVREGARLAVVLPSLQVDDGAVVNRINTVLRDGGFPAVVPPLIGCSPGHFVSFVPPSAGTGLQGTVICVNAQVNFVPVTAMIFGSTAAIPLRAAVSTSHE